MSKIKFFTEDGEFIIDAEDLFVDANGKVYECVCGDTAPDFKERNDLDWIIED